MLDVVLINNIWNEREGRQYKCIWREAEEDDMKWQKCSIILKPKRNKKNFEMDLVRIKGNASQTCNLVCHTPIIQWCDNGNMTYCLSIIFDSITITDAITKLKINAGVCAWRLVWDICATLLLKNTKVMGDVYFSVIVDGRGLFDIPNHSSYYQPERLLRQILGGSSCAHVFTFQGFYHIVARIATYYTELTTYYLRAEATQIYITMGNCAILFNG